MAIIYRKTEKAQAEIDSRAHRLVPRLRTALILVDGRRTDDELRKMIMLQADETLAALLEQGFIEIAAQGAAVQAVTTPRAAHAAPKPAAADKPAFANTGPGGRPFEPWRREAVRAFTDAVGPMAEALAMKMEKARDAAELRPLLEVARQIIANSRGGAAAQQFAARFIDEAATA